MRFVCLQENLKSALGIIERIAGRNNTLPILGSVLFRNDQGRLRLVVTDLEIGLTTWCAGKIEGEGVFAFPARLLAQFLTHLPSQIKLQLDFRASNLTITTEGAKATFRGLEPKDFPIIPAFKPQHVLTMPITPFVTGLSQILPAAATHEGRPEINGVFVHYLNKEVYLAATDTFRLAEKSLVPSKYQNESGLELRAIVPTRAMQEVVRVFSGVSGEMVIELTDTQVRFLAPSIELVSRLNAGEYPNYHAIIPTKFATHTVVAAQNLANTIRGAAVFATKLNNIQVAIEVPKRVIRVSAVDPDKGDHTATISAEASGDALEVSFNYRYLLDGVEAIPTSELEFAATTISSPAVLKPRGDPSFLYVIMPIRKT
ncbi:DNA polymerase III subunit beta [Candidatus Parcubacteria bacterium]|nr:DNA polymerase III subunit beta [Candidatus Parcubacteria bacterium]